VDSPRRRRIASTAPEIALQANLVFLEKTAGITGPQSQRWEDMMDTLVGNAKEIRRLALNANNDFREVPKAFATMTRTCTRCHDEFWLK
jgi:cytochrome c556